VHDGNAVGLVAGDDIASVAWANVTSSRKFIGLLLIPLHGRGGGPGGVKAAVITASERSEMRAFFSS
jgi:hypothetical protein